jgi:hypothetical protein
MKVRIRKEARCDSVVIFYVERWDWYKPWWRIVEQATGGKADEAALKCAKELLNPLIVRL